MKKIAFVCQRYGEEVNGGAEAECRMYAERLTSFFNVEVITTCALDYVTWANHYPEGWSELNGVKIRRFRVKRIRRRRLFAALSSQVTKEKHSDLTEAVWLREQGPYSPDLMAYLHRHGTDYDAVLFMTYLYYPTARGIREPCRRKILIPTAHDEWPIYQRQYDRVFEEADAYVYNAPAEKRFVEKRFPVSAGRPGITIGAGVTYPAGELPSAEERFGIRGPYLCYSGRIDPSKGCETLFEYFMRYQDRHNNCLKLVLTGKAAMEIPERPDIHVLGFVSEEEKYAVMKDAAALVLASELESLSIVVLESMMMGRPVLVNGKCEVLKDHCTMSNAGFYFYNYEEFEAELDYLLDHPSVYAQMCENGKNYVRDRYQWDHIIRQLAGLIDAETAQTAGRERQ